MNLIEYEIQKNREIDDYEKNVEIYAKNFHKAVSFVLTGISVILLAMIPTLRGTTLLISVILAFLMIVDFTLTMFFPKYLDTKTFMSVSKKIKAKTLEIILEARKNNVELILPLPKEKLANYEQSIYSEIMSVSQYVKNNDINASLKDVILISVISVTQKSGTRLIKKYTITKRQKNIIEKLKKYYDIDTEKYCNITDNPKEYELKLIFR